MLNLLRAEIIKFTRLKLTLFIAFSPLILTGLVVVVMTFIKLAGADFGPAPVTATVELVPIGGGTFGLASQILIVAVNGIYLIGLVIAGAMTGSNEYGWHTIKMLATREPSRARIMLSKTLYLLTLAVFMVVLTTICWLLLGLFFKAMYDVGATGSQDGDAIAKGLGYLYSNFFVNFLWSAMTMFMAVRFRSVVIAIIFYFIINTLDGAVSNLGQAALTGKLGTSFPNWLEGLINIGKFLAPFLVNFSQSQLINRDGGPDFVQAVPLFQSVLVLLVWMTIYIFGTVSVFRNRDITE